MTKEQNAANLRSAERLIAIQLGIDNQGGTWRDGLSYEQRVAYDKALAAYIVAHPDAFAAGTLATAKHVSGENLTPLSDASFDWDQFNSALLDNAGNIAESVADVGKGAQAALSSFKWILPVALIVAVVIGLAALNRRLAK